MEKLTGCFTRIRPLAGLAVLFCGAIQMQAQIPVSVQIDGVNCPAGAFTASSYSIPKGETISLSKQFDVCSPALFEALAEGRHFATLTLTESNGSGQELKIVATEVMVAGFTIAESSSSGAPAETWSFDYAKYSSSYLAASGANTFDLGPVSLHGSTTTVRIPALGCAFDALNWSFEASQPTSVTSGGGIGAGRPDFSAVSIMKPVDSCSAVLGQALSSKKSLPEVTITTQLNGSLTPLLEITLKNAVVVTNSTSTPTSGSATELITLGWSQIEIEYVSLQGNVQAGWNVTTNKSI